MIAVAVHDSLIARKCGLPIALESAARADAVLASGHPGEDRNEGCLSDLDFWVRADGHRRNPGTTADLVSASLFVALHDGWLPTQTRHYLPSMER